MEKKSFYHNIACENRSSDEGLKENMTTHIITTFMTFFTCLWLIIKLALVFQNVYVYIFAFLQYLKPKFNLGRKQT